ncbi:hypothetical protein J8273_6743 [Carpediemonas membranifera]|uniref:TmcB/TmcC TPR repeats domain-containing protein n=1 Tax=Carpediemonas membranifera TaxID=201153 RepID=A0A8J6BW04_9EUKA|nr:hypothetical protein J8273_6743 [Carpediemonas membranifera]|eukprot:KAG9391941.1 hypothetical protein J8273_6743 [Carpediemonas membranifera]
MYQFSNLSSRRSDGTDSPHVARSVASTSRHSASRGPQTGAIGFLAPLDMNILQKRMCFHVSTVRSRQWKWRRLYRLLNTPIPLELLGIALSPAIHNDSSYLFWAFRFFLPLTYIGSNTTAVVAACAGVSIAILFLLAWLCVELILNRNGRSKRRVSLLDTLIRVLVGPLLIPAAQVLAAPLLKEGGTLADLTAPSFAWYLNTLVTGLGRVGLAVLVAFTLFSGLVHFSETVSSTSVRFVDFPTLAIFVQPLLSVAVTVINTTAAAGLGLSLSAYVPAVAICFLSFAALVGLIIFPPHASLLRWLWSLITVLMPCFVAPISVYFISLVPVAVVATVICAVFVAGTKVFLLHLLFGKHGRPVPLDHSSLSRVPSGVLKLDNRSHHHASSIIPLEQDELPPDWGNITVAHYVYLQVQTHRLFRARIKHNSDRFDMLSVTSPTARADKTKATLIAHLFRITQTAAARTRSSRDRITLVLFSIHIDANHDAALFDIGQIPRLIERGVLRGMSTAGMMMLTAVRCEANRLRQRQETGFTSDELADLHNKERQAKVLAQGARRSIHQFWRSLDSKNPRAEDLARVAENIYAQSSQADHLFIEVLRAFPRRVHLIKHYAEFLTNVKRENETADRLREIADQIALENRDLSDDESHASESQSNATATTVRAAMTVSDVLTLHVSNSQSPTVRKLRRNVCALMLVLTGLFLFASIFFQLANIFYFRLLALQRTIAAGQVAAARATFLTMAISENYDGFDTAEMADPGGAINTLSDALGAMDALDVTILGFLATDVFDAINDAWVFRAGLAATVPAVVQYDSASPIDLGQTLLIQLREAAAGDTRSAHLALANSAVSFRVAMECVADSIGSTLSVFWYIVVGTFAVIWGITVTVVLLLQIFVLKKSFVAVRRYHEEHFNIFLHVPARLVRHLVNVTNVTTKRKRLNGSLTKAALERRVISFQTPSMGSQQFQDSFLNTATLGKSTLDFDRDEDQEFDDFDDDDEGESLRISTDTDSQAYVLMKDDNGVDLAEIVTDLAGMHSKLHFRLRLIWVVLVTMLAVGVGIICVLVCTSSYIIYLYPQLRSSFDEADKTVLVIDELQDLLDSRTWDAMRVAHGRYLKTEQDYWAINSSTADVVDALTLAASDLGSTHDGLVAALNSERSLAYLEANSILLSRSAWGLGTESRCQLTGWSYNLTAETAYQADRAVYGPDRAKWGYYSDSAADLALDPADKIEIARAVIADDKYWALKTGSTAGILDVRTFVLARSTAEVSTLVTEQATVLKVQGYTLTTLLVLRILATAILVVGLFINLRMKVVDINRLDVIREMYRLGLDAMNGEVVRHPAIVALGESTDSLRKALDRADVVSRSRASLLSLRSQTRSPDVMSVDSAHSPAFSVVSIARSTRSGTNAFSVGLSSLMRDASEATTIFEGNEQKIAAISQDKSFLGRMNALGKNLFLNVFIMIIILLCLSVALNFVADNIGTRTLTLNDQSQVKHDFLSDASDFSVALRGVLRASRLFSQHFETARLEEVEDAIAVDPTLFVLVDDDVDEQFTATVASFRSHWTAMVNLTRVSAQLGIWAAAVPATVAPSLHNYEYDGAAEPGYASDLLSFPGRAVYHNSTYDATLSSDTQAALSRSLLFDDKFEYLIDSMRSELDSLRDMFSAYSNDIVDTQGTEVIMLIGVFIGFVCAVICTYYMFCRFVLQIATPPALQKINVVRQHLELPRILKFRRISTSTLWVIAVVLSLFIAYTGLLYFPVSRTVLIADEASRAAYLFDAASRLFDIATKPSLSNHGYVAAAESMDAIRDLTQQLNDFDLFLSVTGVSGDRTDDRTLDNSTFGATPREVLASFRYSADGLDPAYSGECISIGGLEGADFLSATQLAVPLGDLYDENTSIVADAITAFHYGFWLGQVPLLLLGITVLLASYRVVFHPIFRRLSDDEKMVSGLLDMIPRDQIIPDTLLGDFLGVTRAESG